MQDSLLEKYYSLKKNPSSGIFKTRKVRDLLINELTDELWLVIASDSDGGIGPKEKDVVKCSGYELGRLAARVPLMEMIACGAQILSVVDVLSVEMDPSGKEIIEGVRDEVKDAGLDANLAVTGSTEDNIPTVQSGMGVVVIGIVKSSDFNPSTSEVDDVIACVGLPRSGPDDVIKYDDNNIADTKSVSEIVKLDFVHDVLPVGSKGIQYEAEQLAWSSKLHFEIINEAGLDLKKSAGPSTCFILSLPSNDADKLKKRINKPVSIIGKLNRYA